MPIYEFYCPECEFKFERLLPLSKSGEASPCPQCHRRARRAISSFACPSGGTEEGSDVGGSSACSTCSALSCASCHM
jgi:putative FmdB family regulatory protein